MLQSSTESQFATLRSGVVLITLASVIIYAVVSVIEVPVLKRFGSAG